MASDIKLESETFYWLRNSSGLYLDGTDFECILLVPVMTCIFFYYGHPRRQNSNIATLRDSVLTYIFHSCLHIFSRQVKVCYFLCYFEVLSIIPFVRAVRNCHLIMLNLEYPLKVIRSLLCNLA